MDQINWCNVEHFFYATMLKVGYPSEHPTLTDGGNGFRLITHASDDLYFEDRWTRTPESNKSSGTTTIFMRFPQKDNNRPTSYVPIWAMHYGGWYTRGAALFLKEILRTSYETSMVEFRGCRGPFSQRKETGALYTNTLHPLSSFTGFRGEECIVSNLGLLSGEHIYFGHALI